MTLSTSFVRSPVAGVPTRYLTKSRFKTALTCPTKLFYTGKADYANTMVEDDFLAMLADGGFQVGELAKVLHPGGHEIASKDNAQALAETAEWMQREEVVLFEPAFMAQGCLVRVDILIKRGRHIEVVEVKAKWFDSRQPGFEGRRGGISSGMLPYLQDVAFQKYVVARALPRCTVTASLMLADKSRPATVDGLNQMFKVRRSGRATTVTVKPEAHLLTEADSVLTKVSVDHLVDQLLSAPFRYPGGEAALPELVEAWSGAYARDERIAPVIGSQCAGCEFRAEPGGPLRSGFHECWMSATGWAQQDFPRHTVLDLWNFRGKQRLIDERKFKLSQVSQDDIGYRAGDAQGLSHSERQWMQIAGLPAEHRARGFHLDGEGLRAEMSHWAHPWHMIDFETAALALPVHKGRRPYEQVAFQFSHHVVEADGSVRHADEFLLTQPGAFPNYAFVRALRAALVNDNGTIFRWSHHENTILSAIRQQLLEDAAAPSDASELIAFIDSITKGGPRAMVDLADVARRRYFHPNTQGSCSIKQVLPSVLNASAFLSARYGGPCYGSRAPGGIPSHNFRDMVWWTTDGNGAVRDPYRLLLDQGSNLPDAAINQGGAATAAYMRLQFEDLPEPERDAINAALLRYCELDTLAMVMILQAWTQWAADQG